MVLGVVWLVGLFVYGVLSCTDKYKDKMECFEQLIGGSFSLFVLLCFVFLGTLLAASGKAA